MGSIFYATAFRPALRPTQLRIQLIPGALSPEVKRPGCQADHSPPSSTMIPTASEFDGTCHRSIFFVRLDFYSAGKELFILHVYDKLFSARKIMESYKFIRHQISL